MDGTYACAQVAGVVLQSAFTSILRIAHAYLPLGMVLTPTYALAHICTGTGLAAIPEPGLIAYPHLHRD